MYSDSASSVEVGSSSGNGSTRQERLPRQLCAAEEMADGARASSMEEGTRRKTTHMRPHRFVDCTNGGKVIRSPALGINSGRRVIKRASFDGLFRYYSREASHLNLLYRSLSLESYQIVNNSRRNGVGASRPSTTYRT
jgi:hypothetical protein